jgi:hypothetical protein
MGAGLFAGSVAVGLLLPGSTTGADASVLGSAQSAESTGIDWFICWEYHTVDP